MQVKTKLLFSALLVIFFISSGYSQSSDSIVFEHESLRLLKNIDDFINDNPTKKNAVILTDMKISTQSIIQLIDSTKVSSVRYSEYFQMVNSSLNVIKFQPKSIQKSELQCLKEDCALKVKGLQSSTISISADAGIKVIVTTRKKVNGEYKNVSGYIVKCNPWLEKDKSIARYSFNNKTNPSSEMILLAGGYDFWVEDGTSQIKIPQNRTLKKVIPNENNVVELYIDID